MSPCHARLLQRLRWQLLRNAAREVTGPTRTRVLTIVLCSLVVWVGVYGVSIYGFRELRQFNIPFNGLIVALLFDFLFLSLTTLLLFSNGLILFGALFAAAEARFLLTTPAAADRVFAHKFQASLGFSSWAFVLLGCPLLIAYGVSVGAPWYFYALLPAFFFGFALVPGSLSALLCLLIANYLPRRRKRLFVGLGLAVVAVGLVWGYGVAASANDLLGPNGRAWGGRGSVQTGPDSRDAIQALLGRFTFSQGEWLPGRWTTRGLMAAARGDPAGTALPLALLWSNGLFLYLITAWVSARLYRRGYDRLASGGPERREYRGSWLDRGADLLVCYLDPQTRLLIGKDFRTFRRDPMQWAQVLIFGCLLLMYFANSRHFYQQDIGRAYQHGVSLLALTVTAMLMCAYMGRFIYPMLSLEGRKFWVLGLLPMRRERLLWGKFAFAATGALLVAEVLVLLSDAMLGLSAVAVGVHALTVAVLAVGLSGLSVGLGAWMPNFRESDPSRIAVGFGGTLNLIVSLLYLVLVIALMAGPYHVMTALAGADEAAADRLLPWVTAGVFAGVGLGVLAVWLPLRVGARKLRAMEF